MKLIFSYGKRVEAGLERLKAFKEVAARHGMETGYVEYDFEASGDERAAKLLDIVKKEPDPSGLVLVGSSMGAYGSLLASMQVPVKGLFLISPALFMYDVRDYRLGGAEKTFFVVGWKDTVIPRDKVLDYVKSVNGELLVVDNDHLMFSSLPLLTALFDEFLTELEG